MSLISRARAGDKQAIETMFRQFIPPDEPIDSVAFLGLKGLLGIGVHSFGALTARRAASLEVTALGGLTYSDGYHEHINGTVVFHPSRLLQIIVSYSIGIFWVVLLATLLLSEGSRLGKVFGVLAVLGLIILTIPITAKLFYHFVKSGLVLVVREGVSVMVFADRNSLPIANQLSQRASQLREVRLRTMPGSNTVVTTPTSTMPAPPGTYAPPVPRVGAETPA